MSQSMEQSAEADPGAEVRRRWRLILGSEAQHTGNRSLAELNESDTQIDESLSFLFDREQEGRAEFLKERSAGLDPSTLSVPDWLGRVRRLFPRSTAEQLTRYALERYQLTEILADESTLSQLKPDIDLLKAVLSVKSILPDRVIGMAKQIVRDVVEQLLRKLAFQMRRHFTGARRSPTQSRIPLARNFDVRTTIRRNLKHYQPSEKRLLIERAYFHSRTSRRHAWDLIILVDQSGSMTDSVIHSAVMASIFRSLPLLKTCLVVFDTNIVDLTDTCDDPVEVLMKVQLGGGTDIAKALRYGRQFVTQPRRSICVLVTDFHEGGPEAELLRIASELIESGVTLLGLAALDERAEPAYHRRLADRLARMGARIGAMTPEHLAQWVADKVRS